MVHDVLRQMSRGVFHRMGRAMMHDVFRLIHHRVLQHRRMNDRTHLNLVQHRWRRRGDKGSRYHRGSRGARGGDHGSVSLAGMRKGTGKLQVEIAGGRGGGR